MSQSENSIVDSPIDGARRGRALQEGIRARQALVDRLDYISIRLTLGLPVVGTAAALLLAACGHGPGVCGITLLVIFYFATVTGIEVGFHRMFSHQSFKAAPVVYVALGVLGSMAAQGPVIWWAATHRRHHGAADRPGDPHSPNLHGSGIRNRLRGLAYAQTGWLLNKENVKPAGWAQAGGYLFREPLAFFVHVKYFYWIALGLVLPTVIGGVVTRTWEGALMGFLWGGLLRIFLMNNIFWAINSLSHSIGTRPFNNGPDKSRNNAVLALLTQGSGWHNNHHAFPSSAITSFEWWQFDPGAIVIRGLEILGLVSKVKYPTRLTRNERRQKLQARYAAE